MNGRFGERQLLAGVLTLAIDDERKGGRLQQDSEKWIFSDRDGTFTLRWVCDHLDLDAAVVRLAARNGKATPRTNSSLQNVNPVRTARGDVRKVLRRKAWEATTC